MQGIKVAIPADKKIRYLQSLLAVDFDILDCGSFVSPRAVPQMADTAEVLEGLDMSDTQTKLSVIVGNRRGAELALQQDKVTYLGFPFSVSAKFQEYNTNLSREEGLEMIGELQNMVQKTGKELIIYISMGFGNPYGEPWSVDLVQNYTAQLADLGIKSIKLSDTIGAAQTADIESIFTELIPKYPEINFGAHFHTVYADWFAKIDAAWRSGCRNFDGAILGKGGCPMSKSDMVGNMPTEKLISFIAQNNLEHNLDMHNFQLAYNRASELFDAIAH